MNVGGFRSPIVRQFDLEREKQAIHTSDKVGDPGRRERAAPYFVNPAGLAEFTTQAFLYLELYGCFGFLRHHITLLKSPRQSSDTPNHRGSPHQGLLLEQAGFFERVLHGIFLLAKRAVFVEVDIEICLLEQVFEFFLTHLIDFALFVLLLRL